VFVGIFSSPFADAEIGLRRASGNPVTQRLLEDFPPDRFFSARRKARDKTAVSDRGPS